jgi:hypothetical protein
MVAPSKVFTTIADSRIDPESIIDTDLMTQLRDNDIHMNERIGGSFTADKDHTHDGVGSALVPGNVFGTLFAYYNYG